MGDPLVFLFGASFRSNTLNVIIFVLSSRQKQENNRHRKEKEAFVIRRKRETFRLLKKYEHQMRNVKLSSEKLLHIIKGFSIFRYCCINICIQSFRRTHDL